MTACINQLALLAADDSLSREELIKEQEHNILRAASSACRRFVTKSDDEWSIALSSFSRAVDVYDEEKGDFLPFAQMLIKRDLIGHFRKQRRTACTVPVAPHVLEGSGEPEEDTEGAYMAVAKQSMEASDNGLRDEILAVNGMLEEYGFRFMDLTECSPRQDKTRSECAAAVRYLLADRALMDAMKKTGKLPMKQLVSGSGVSRKILDRYRKYVIAAALILDGDYPEISGYLKFIGEEETV